MGGKLEVGWVRAGEDGVKQHVFAVRHGREWRFFERPRRKGQDVEWQPAPDPSLEDWLELMSGLERRAARDLIPPAEIDRMRQVIRQRFPDHSF